VGFRDQSEAAATRIESLERALEETQRRLEAVRAELDAERASRGDTPSALAAQRSEIEALRARLEVKGRHPRVEPRPLPQKPRNNRGVVSVIYVLFFVIVVVVGALSGSRAADDEHVASRWRALVTCVDEAGRRGSGDLSPRDPAESGQPPR
jgi:hypothetical protein